MSQNMLEVVRIKDPSGVERNATRAEAKRINAKVLDGEAVVDKHGRPRPSYPTAGKPRTDLATAVNKATDKNTKES
jgi:hypothetical protein